MQRLLLPILLVLVGLLGCQTATVPDPIPDATVENEAVETTVDAEPPTVEPTVRPTEPASITETPYPVSDPTNLTEDEYRFLMYELSDGRPAEAARALDIVALSGDERLIPVLIELIRAGQLGLIEIGRNPQIGPALAALSGQTFDLNYPAWVEWYGGTDIEPPEEFVTWKGRWLSRIDPRFGEFFQSSQPRTVRVEEIQWGGVVVDGIPALDYVPQIPAAEADYVAPEEPVFGLSINGDSRAYPLRFMDWHEMANDVVGGVPVSIAYCTLCGAAIAFDGRAPDGNTYDFGSSGFLLRSNKLMYDRQTRTLWNQLTGEPVMGPLAGAEWRLDVLPIVLTTWDDWQAQHPETTVLSQETGHSRDYRLGAAYGDYFSAPETMFPVWQRSDLLPAKSHIFALRLDGVPKAYPLEQLAEEPVLNDSLAGQDIVLVTRGEIVEVEGESLRAGSVEYTYGAQVRAYARGDYAFAPGDSADAIVDQNGGVWQVTEDALLGPNGESLERLGGHLAYWFGWYAFFPNTELYGVDG